MDRSNRDPILLVIFIRVYQSLEYIAQELLQAAYEDSDHEEASNHVCCPEAHQVYRSISRIMLHVWYYTTTPSPIAAMHHRPQTFNTNQSWQVAKMDRYDTGAISPTETEKSELSPAKPASPSPKAKRPRTPRSDKKVSRRPSRKNLLALAATWPI